MVEKGMAPARAELLRGVIVEKMPKSPLHTKLTARLLRAFQAALGDSCWVRKEEPLTMKDSEPEPDIAIVPGQESDYMKHPTSAQLVIEVSITTLSEDRALASLYAEAGVPEYWIVDGRGLCVEVFSQPENGNYRKKEIVSSGATLKCQNLPGVAISVDDLFANLP